MFKMLSLERNSQGDLLDTYINSAIVRAVPAYRGLGRVGPVQLFRLGSSTTFGTVLR
jgi:hypothetical protein